MSIGRRYEFRDIVVEEDVVVALHYDILLDSVEYAMLYVGIY